MIKVKIIFLSLIIFLNPLRASSPDSPNNIVYETRVDRDNDQIADTILFEVKEGSTYSTVTLSIKNLEVYRVDLTKDTDDLSLRAHYTLQQGVYKLSYSFATRDKVFFKKTQHVDSSQTEAGVCINCDEAQLPTTFLNLSAISKLTDSNSTAIEKIKANFPLDPSCKEPGENAKGQAALSDSIRRKRTFENQIYENILNFSKDDKLAKCLEGTKEKPELPSLGVRFRQLPEILYSPQMPFTSKMSLRCVDDRDDCVCSVKDADACLNTRPNGCLMQGYTGALVQNQNQRVILLSNKLRETVKTTTEPSNRSPTASRAAKIKDRKNKNKHRSHPELRYTLAEELIHSFGLLDEDKTHCLIDKCLVKSKDKDVHCFSNESGNVKGKLNDGRLDTENKKGTNNVVVEPAPIDKTQVNFRGAVALASGKSTAVKPQLLAQRSSEGADLSTRSASSPEDILKEQKKETVRVPASLGNVPKPTRESVAVPTGQSGVRQVVSAPSRESFSGRAIGLLKDTFLPTEANAATSSSTVQAKSSSVSRSGVQSKSAAVTSASGKNIRTISSVSNSKAATKSPSYQGKTNETKTTENTIAKLQVPSVAARSQTSVAIQPTETLSNVAKEKVSSDPSQSAVGGATATSSTTVIEKTIVKSRGISPAAIPAPSANNSTGSKASVPSTEVLINMLTKSSIDSAKLKLQENTFQSQLRVRRIRVLDAAGQAYGAQEDKAQVIIYQKIHGFVQQ